MSHPGLNGQTVVYGILGQPVKSSLSPAMQNAAFAACSLNAVYIPLPLPPERFEEGIRGLQALGVAGFNLTVPHKTAILPYLDDLTPEATAIGAVNTVRCDGGRLYGTNTDGVGFLKSLDLDLGWQPRGKQALMLGAGGAGRGVAHSLLGADLAGLTIANRSKDRADSLAAELRTAFDDRSIESRGLRDCAGLEADLLINTTTVGMGDGESPLNLTTVGIADGVVDIVYTPAQTPLLEQAASLGLPHTNGIGMLLYQGAHAFEFWTGQPAPAEAMRKGLLDALAARG